MINDKQLKEVQDLLDELLYADNAINELEKKLKDVKEIKDRLTYTDIPLKLAEYNLSELKTVDGSSIIVKPEYRGHISKENKDDAHTWLRENEHGDLIKNQVKTSFGKGEDKDATDLMMHLTEEGIGFTHTEAVHHSSLKAFIREQTEKGNDLPHDLLGIFVGQKATIKRGK